MSMFTAVTLAIGYYNRHIHSGDGDTTDKNTIKLFKKRTIKSKINIAYIA